MLVSFPPLTDMLKFSGSSFFISGGRELFFSFFCGLLFELSSQSFVSPFNYTRPRSHKMRLLRSRGESGRVLADFTDVFNERIGHQKLGFPSFGFPSIAF